MLALKKGMKLLNKIRPVWFFLSFGVGLLVCYMFTPPPPVVVRFPSPNNAGKVLYRDDEDNCYAYKADAVECTSKSKEQPIAIDAA
jgi:hypothetical protein